MLGAQSTESEQDLLSRYPAPYRGAIRRKVQGLTRDEATRQWCHRFQEAIAGRMLETVPTEEEFAVDETIVCPVAGFDAAYETSREILAKATLRSWFCFKMRSWRFAM